jgi:hypothetical protein
MRIGILFPWITAAETQELAKHRIVAEKLGHTVVHCRNSQDILDSQPDFVLAWWAGQPKLTSVPTYAVLHRPEPLVQNGASIQNFTYDGYFTLPDKLREFTSHLLVAARRRAYRPALSNQPDGGLGREIRPAARLAYF